MRILVLLAVMVFAAVLPEVRGFTRPPLVRQNAMRSFEFASNVIPGGGGSGARVAATAGRDYLRRRDFTQLPMFVGFEIAKIGFVGFCVAAVVSYVYNNIDSIREMQKETIGQAMTTQAETVKNAQETQRIAIEKAQQMQREAAERAKKIGEDARRR